MRGIEWQFQFLDDKRNIKYYIWTSSLAQTRKLASPVILSSNVTIHNNEQTHDCANHGADIWQWGETWDLYTPWEFTCSALIPHYARVVKSGQSMGNTNCPFCGTANATAESGIFCISLVFSAVAVVHHWKYKRRNTKLSCCLVAWDTVRCGPVSPTHAIVEGAIVKNAMTPAYMKLSCLSYTWNFFCHWCLLVLFWNITTSCIRSDDEWCSRNITIYSNMEVRRMFKIKHVLEIKVRLVPRLEGLLNDVCCLTARSLALFSKTSRRCEETRATCERWHSLRSATKQPEIGQKQNFSSCD